MPFYILFRDFQRAERPVVPVIVSVVVVDIRESAIVRVATIEAIVATL